MVFFSPQHFDNFAAGEAVPEAITGHYKACPFLGNLYLHYMGVGNDVLSNIDITNSPAAKHTLFCRALQM